MRHRARVGDVFRVPAAEGEWAFGQVVDQAGPQHLVVIFSATSGSVGEVLASTVQLAGIVFDAKLRNGDWPIVANLPPVPVRRPWFILGHEDLGDLRLESFDGTETRPAAPGDVGRHRHRTISSPMALQWAVEATHGRREWIPELEPYRRLAVELGGG